MTKTPDTPCKKVWNPPGGVKEKWNTVCQIVVQMGYHNQTLSFAHDHPFAAHLGVTKTYNRILKKILARSKNRCCRLLSFLSNVPKHGKSQ